MISRHYPLPNLDQAQYLLEQIFSGIPAVPPQEKDRSVILYGAGNLGKMACKFLDYVGVKILYAYDFGARDGYMLNGTIPVYPPERAGKNKNHLILVTTTSVPFTKIEEYLSSMGWKRILPFYDYAIQYTDLHPLNNGWFSGILTSEDKDKMRKVLSIFQDAFSYGAYLQFLAWRILREEWLFENNPIRLDNRYFIEPIRKIITDHEIFLDIGAHEGEAFITFLQKIGGKFQSAYLFEPDDESYIALKKIINDFPIEIRQKTKIIKKALGKNKEHNKFGHCYGYASRAWEKSTNYADFVRIDDLKVPISFIKLHIEGSELEALEGGELLLSECRPLIIVTVYHNRDGLWKIPLFLNKILKQYHYYFRLHGWCGTGGVIYGIPNEKIW